jgi:hypothetical protein
MPSLTTTATRAGMSVKFFALFFLQRCAMSPVYTSALAAVSPVVVSAASMVAERVSKAGMGRLQVRVVGGMAMAELFIHGPKTVNEAYTATLH